MNTVVFAHRAAELTPSALLPNKVELFGKLKDRDIEPVISLGAESAFKEGALEVEYLASENTTSSAGSVALESVAMIVNRLDRSVKYSQLPEDWASSDVPVLNENILRSLVYRKHVTHADLLEPLHLGISTAFVESRQDVEAFVDEHSSDEYIVKPTSGTFSRGVVRLSANETVHFFDEEENLGKMVVQPAYNFSRPFPTSFEAYDAQAEPNFDTWSKSTARKELRMYGFHADGKTDVFPVARAMENGDQWFFVKPESLPETLFSDTRTVLSRAAQLTSSRAIYGALDIAYGSKSEQEDPGFHVVELNGRMPYLIGYDKHAGVADTLRDMKADQIQRVVQNGRL